MRVALFFDGKNHMKDPAGHSQSVGLTTVLLRIGL